MRFCAWMKQEVVPSKSSRKKLPELGHNVTAVGNMTFIAVEVVTYSHIQISCLMYDMENTKI